MKIAIPIIFVLMLFTARCQAQEVDRNPGVFDSISKDQTIEQRRNILNKLDLEKLARQQFKSSPKYIFVAGFALDSPGADHRVVSRDQRVIAPMTGCTSDQPQEWREIAIEYALRWNLLMRHLESEQNPKYKSNVSFAQIQSHYRIADPVFNSLTLESKLMMQYTIVQLIEQRHRNYQLGELLDENGILEPFPTEGE